MKKNNSENRLAGDLLVSALKKTRRPVTLMEVCGTHTVSFFTSGVKKLLAPKIKLISGPGCPVCVTEDEDIEKILQLATQPDVILATFGDMFRVPGVTGSLETARAGGARIEIVYSPLDTLELSGQNQDKKVIFLAVGFETTVPAVAAAVLEARRRKLKNFFIYPLLKTIPKILDILFSDRPKIDGLVLPGHVSAIIGAASYRFLVKKFNLPCVVAGFEPLDLAESVYLLAGMLAEKKPDLEIQYKRVVTMAGNQKAQKMIKKVFQKSPALWRGLGVIPDTGLDLKKEFQDIDARSFLPEKIRIAVNPLKKQCLCGEILKGRKTPPDCRLFRKVCAPQSPVGPCMVSSEGACSAYFKYGD
jgi:hydrogenase expression/formation protein HypD